MSEPKPFPPSPFKGPNPLEYGDRIYGRNREIIDLYNQLCASRIVVLHSPSGAGKSSLVQAGLLPQLEAQFDVWGPARVHEPCNDSNSNRFASSLIRSLESSEGAHLSSLDLVSYATQRRNHTDPVVIVLDQFEEIITADQLNRKAIQGFFEQLGALLHDPSYFALFTIREDYLASLDAYRGLIPTQFNNRFRIDLLSIKAARAAIAKSAENAQYPFDEAAVDKLTDDLATVQVLQSDGTTLNRVGDFIEPVYLQVACSELWSKLGKEANRTKRSIDIDDVKTLGDVSTALSSFYSSRLASISAGDGRLEEQIREWFGEKLITPAKRRGQVLKGESATEGLDNSIVQLLSKEVLIRRDVRAGSEWFELAHDRLIPAVLRDNEAWLERQIPLQRAARRWIRNDRRDRFLVMGPELILLRKDATPDLLDPDSRFFLAACDAAEFEQMEREQARRRLNRLATLIVILLGLFTPIGLYAFIALLENPKGGFDDLVALIVSSPVCAGLAFLALKAFRWYSSMNTIILRLTRKLRMDPSLQRSTLLIPKSAYSSHSSGDSSVLDQWEAQSLELAPYWVMLIVAGSDGVISRKETNFLFRFLLNKGIVQRELVLDEFIADTRPALVGVTDVIAIYKAKKSAVEFDKFRSNMLLLARSISKPGAAVAASIECIEKCFETESPAGLGPGSTGYFSDSGITSISGSALVCFFAVGIAFILALFYAISLDLVNEWHWIAREAVFLAYAFLVVAALHWLLLRMKVRRPRSRKVFAWVSALSAGIFTLSAQLSSIIFDGQWWQAPFITIVCLLSFKKVSHLAFCDLCNRWPSKSDKGFFLASADPNFESNLRRHLEDGDIEFLDSARLSSSPGPDVSKWYFVSLRSCAICQDFHALSITRTDSSLNARGKRIAKSPVTIVDRLLIDTNRATWLNSRMA